MSSTEKPRVLVIVGGLRSQGRSRKLYAILTKLLSERECSVKSFDPKENPIPFYDEEEATENNPNVRYLLEVTQWAEGIILISPEYHGGMSGTIKNIIDFWEYLQPDYLKGKVATLMGISGGAMGASGSLLQMMMVCRVVRAWVLPRFFSVPSGGQAFDRNGEFANPTLTKRLSSILDELFETIELFRNRKDEAG